MRHCDMRHARGIQHATHTNMQHAAWLCAGDPSDVPRDARHAEQDCAEGQPARHAQRHLRVAGLRRLPAPPHTRHATAHTAHATPHGVQDTAARAARAAAPECRSPARTLRTHSALRSLQELRSAAAAPSNVDAQQLCAPHACTERVCAAVWICSAVQSAAVPWRPSAIPVVVFSPQRTPSAAQASDRREVREHEEHDPPDRTRQYRHLALLSAAAARSAADRTWRRRGAIGRVSEGAERMHERRALGMRNNGQGESE
jgi:hypothetical protein